MRDHPLASRAPGRTSSALLLCAAALLLGGLSSCIDVRLESDYDPVIDQGITQFAEQLSTAVKNMSDAAGQPGGTFDANKATYNALESKLDVLIARAGAASEAQQCKLAAQTLARVHNLFQKSGALPPALATATSTGPGDPEQCNAELLRLVRTQLTDIETIHREADKCAPPANPHGTPVSCLRPASARTALEIIGQSINAVAVVEAARKASGSRQ
jgi:hypothetical protein